MREYAKWFGEIESICDANLKLRLQRMDVNVTAKQANDSLALWNALMSLVGADETNLDPSERNSKVKGCPRLNHSTLIMIDLKCVFSNSRV